MNHDYIVESNLIDQYVLGKLAADQVEEFEAHFVDCPECVDQLNISRSFVRDLKGLAVQETLLSEQRREAQTQRRQLPQSVPRRFGWAIAWACVVLAALGFAFLAFRRQNRLEAELRQARQDAVALGQKYQQGLETAAESEKRHQQTNGELVQRLDDLEKRLRIENANKREPSLVRGSEAPEVNFPIYALVSQARGQVPAPIEIAPPASSSRYALSIPLEESKDFSSYRVMISDYRRVTVFNRGGFKPDAYHALSLSLKSNFLIPGTYNLRVEGLTPPNSWNAVGTYPFRVLKRH